MAITVINNDTGLAEQLPVDSANQALMNGTHSVPLVDAEGNSFHAPLPAARDGIAKGLYQQPSDSQIQELNRTAKYSTADQQTKSLLEGAAKGVLPFGISTVIERGLGVKPEDIRGREENNEELSTVGEIGGFAGSSLFPFGQANVLSKLSKASNASLHIGGEGANLMSRLGAHSVAGAVDLMGMQAGDEISKIITKDPQQAVELSSIVDNIVHAGKMGAVFGGVLGAAGEAYDKVAGNKLSKLIDDAKGAAEKDALYPDPVGHMSNELQTAHDAIEKLHVYGDTGLKSQELQKLMPEMNPAIRGQAESIVNKLDSSLRHMRENVAEYPEKYVDAFESRLEKFKNKVEDKIDPLTLEADKVSSSGDVFRGIEDMKKYLQENSKFNQAIHPLEERAFRNTVTDLSRDLRVSLEDPEVWGKVAERQNEINQAMRDTFTGKGNKDTPFSQAIKTFFNNVGGENVVNPNKVETYLKQLGNNKAEIKQDIVKNFVDAAENVKNTVSKTHDNLGLNPFDIGTNLGFTKGTLNEVTAGEKMYQYLRDKGLNHLVAEAGGTAIGASVGHIFGHEGIGALIGERAVTPFLKSILPSMAGSIYEHGTSPGKFMRATEFLLNTAAGDSVLSKSVGNLFKSLKTVIPLKFIPNEKDREKLDESVSSAQRNPSLLMHGGDDEAHYLPNHAPHISMAIANITNYLNGLKPKEDNSSVFNPAQKVSAVDKARYNNALNNAIQPLTPLEKINSGTLTQQDVADMKAMYPSLYKRVSGEMVNNIIEAKGDGVLIPYKQKLMMSLFLGSPLDSTMTQQSILSTQAVPAEQQQPMAINRPPSGKHSMQHLSKLASLENTPNQSREMREATRGS